MIANGSAYLGFPLFAGSGTKSEPPEAKRSIGMLPSDTFPAEWANYLFYRSSENIGRLCTDTNSIKKELNSILEAYGITNDASAYNQLLTALNKIYPKITNCVTPASTQEKSLAIADNVLHVGDIYAVTFTYGNTYGDGSTTYPTLSINNGTAYPICNADGSYAGNGSWSANNTIQFLFTGTKFIMSNSIMTDRVERGLQQAVTSNAVSCIIAANNSFNGPALGSGGQIRVMFTADIAGADTTSAMGVVYNGNAVLVKVCKDGALVNFTAKEVATNTYKYLQAYTTLDLVYDGTNFVIVGNPVVLSSSNYTVYASGYFDYNAYSTSEVKTNKIWIDGKPIYRKAGYKSGNVSGVVLDSSLSSSYVSSVTQIGGSVLIYGSLRSIGGYADANARASVDVGNNGLYFLDTGGSPQNCNWWIEYTKTTD